jgi:hypothetical protein
MENSYGSSGSDAATALGGLFGTAMLCYFLFIALILVAAIYIYFKIWSKTGNSGWLALLMFVPLVNIGMILYLAFSDWPVLKENRDLKARLGYGGTGYIPPAGSYAPPAPQYAPPAQPYAQPTQPCAPPMAPAQPYVPPAAPAAPAEPYAPPAAPAEPYAPPAAPVDPYAPPAPPSEPPVQQ